ncbi:MAG: Hsp33 family molecular chaperone HslO [Planctomycetes bacterium]|nr:Hsp33 family molecular chaperone HslO [Planctomycetota bacterium]
MAAEGTLFLTYLDRQRDLLLVYGDPAPLHRDLELHLLSCGLRHDRRTAGLLKDGLTAMALYLISRPRFESFGWTISLQRPRLNLFFAGSARENTVVGRAFLENVQPAPRHLFYAQISRPFGELQTSSVEVEGSDIFKMVEQFCSRSDQQPVRFFRGKGPRAALASPFPGADRNWFRSAGAAEVMELENSGGLKLIADRSVLFRCGCDRKMITAIVVKLYRQDPEELFRGDPEVEVECPRCGAKHAVTREQFKESSAAAGP